MKSRKETRVKLVALLPLPRLEVGALGWQRATRDELQLTQLLGYSSLTLLQVRPLQMPNAH